MARSGILLLAATALVAITFQQGELETSEINRTLKHPNHELLKNQKKMIADENNKKQ